MKKFHLLVALALAVAVSLTALSACNTVRGMGKDVESAGESIQKSTN